MVQGMLPNEAGRGVAGEAGLHFFRMLVFLWCKWILVLHARPVKLHVVLVL